MTEKKVSLASMMGCDCTPCAEDRDEIPLNTIKCSNCDSRKISWILKHDKPGGIEFPLCNVCALKSLDDLQ
jgi:hypothetical protein